MLAHLAHHGPHALALVKRQEGELRPEIDEVTVGEDGVGLAELVVDEAHDEGEVMLSAVARVLYLRRLELGLLLLFRVAGRRLHRKTERPDDAGEGGDSVEQLRENGERRRVGEEVGDGAPNPITEDPDLEWGRRPAGSVEVPKMFNLRKKKMISIAKNLKLIYVTNLSQIILLTTKNSKFIH